MTTEFTFLVGLPCSGKSRAAANLARSLGGVVVDDPKDFDRDFPLSLEGKKVCVADCFLVEERLRKRAEERLSARFEDAEFFWIFFENDPEQCLRNFERRVAEGDDRRVAESIRQMSKKYRVPEGAATLEVWRP